MKQHRSRPKNPKPAPKSFFHLAEPFCNEYLKLKHASYQKSMKLYSLKNKDRGKENGNMYEFRKPRSGYYALKGCSLDYVNRVMGRGEGDGKDRDRDGEERKGKSEFLNFFLKNYVEKKDRQQSYESQLPCIKYSQPYMYPSMQPNHLKSLTLQNIPANPFPPSIGRYSTKLKTEPSPYPQEPRNKSCQQLQPRIKNALLPMDS